jgi:hypothetical protein
MIAEPPGAAQERPMDESPDNKRRAQERPLLTTFTWLSGLEGWPLGLESRGDVPA